MWKHPRPVVKLVMDSSLLSALLCASLQSHWRCKYYFSLFFNFFVVISLLLLLFYYYLSIIIPLLLFLNVIGIALSLLSAVTMAVVAVPARIISADSQ